MNLMRTQKRVKEALLNHKEARNSDNVLYVYVISDIAQERGVDLKKVSAIDLLTHMKEYGFPPFETVRRARQKLQEHNEELRADHDVDAMRYVLEKEYLDYVRRKFDLT